SLGVSNSVTVNPPTPSVVQQGYASNCNAASCGLAYPSSVVAGDPLAFALGWFSHNLPSTPTDTRGDTFTLGASNSVTSGYSTPAVVQQRYAANCNAANCGLGFSSSVTGGNSLVFGLGWYSGGQTYVPITLTNNQGSATPNPFQQKV